VSTRGVAIVLAALAESWSAGCYLSHTRENADGGVSPRGDAGPATTDGGADAPTPRCCTRWSFDTRVAVEPYWEETVTPRLIRLADAPALVATGPEDAVGPSGAHLIRWTRDLRTHEPPVAVTRGSFTWGQPASAGDRFAVCWGTSPGNVARVYDASGVPITGQVTLDENVASPCVASAASVGQFAFAYLRREPATMRSSIRVRFVDVATGVVGPAFDSDLVVETQSASLAGTAEGFVMAVAGPLSTRLVMLDSGGRRHADVTLGPSRRVSVAADEASIVLVRVIDRPIAGMRAQDVWIAQAFDPATLERRSAEAEIATYEPVPSPEVSATMSPCGETMLGTTAPALHAVVSLLDGPLVNQYIPGERLLGPAVGDASVLVIDDDAYVAFSSTAPVAPSPRVQVDHWTCAAH